MKTIIFLYIQEHYLYSLDTICMWILWIILHGKISIWKPVGTNLYCGSCKLWQWLTKDSRITMIQSKAYHNSCHHHSTQHFRLHILILIFTSNCLIQLLPCTLSWHVTIHNHFTVSLTFWENNNLQFCLEFSRIFCEIM